MIVAAALVAGLSSVTVAQVATVPTPTAAGQCRIDANMYQARQLADLRAAGTTLTSALLAPIIAESRRIARDCADKISLNGASVAELTTLASLYLFTTDTAKAKNAVALVFAKSGLTEAERADADIAAEQLAIATFDPFAGINPDAERYVRDLDGMSDAVIARKIEGQQRLLGRYEYADIDDGIRDHARKLLDLAERALRTNALPMVPARPAVGGRAATPAYNSAYQVMTSAYSSLARGAGDFLHADSALMILDAADKAVGATYPFAHESFERHRQMYRLVGTKATPIDGKWWVNDSNGATFMPGDKQVTLIQFTAHWCVPCKNSYPGMKRMTAHFAGKPVESIMVTNLYGYIGSKMKLLPAQEVAEDRDYYAVQHELPFKVAINPLLPRGDSLTRDNDRRYAVSGIPEIVVVDRKGIIRATVVGWDKGNEQRLSALIDRILTEK
jgi:hypothetical protein